MSSKKKIYWDACLFFEWLGNETVTSAERSGLNSVLDDNDAGNNIIVTSVITDLEVVPEKLEAKKPGALSEYNGLFDSVRFHQVEVNKNILSLAREIRDYYYTPADDDHRGGKMMDLGDALHIATAIIADVDEFHTRDDASNGAKVPLLSLYKHSGNDKVCGKYDLKFVSPESDQSELFDDQSPSN